MIPHSRKIRLPRARLPLALIVFAAILRFAILDHGLPDINEEATPVRQAWEMWNWDSGLIDLNPHFFNYPALSFYANWVAQAAYRLVTEPTGWRAWGPSQDLSPDLVLIGRVLAAAFSLATGLMLYRLGTELMPNRWAAWAACSILWMPTFFHYSVLSVVDVPLVLVSTFFLDTLIRSRDAWISTKMHLRLGVLIGLAASCKYTGALLAVPYLIQHFQVSGKNFRLAVLTANPLVAGLTSIAIFLVINPYILLDYHTFQRNFGFERHHMAVGHFGREHGPLSEYGWAMWYNLGPFLIPSTLLGIFLVFSISRQRQRWTPLLGFALFFPCFLLQWTTSFGHYLFPVLPIFSLLGTQGVRMGLTWLKGVQPLRRLRQWVPAVTMIPLMLASLQDAKEYREPAPRTLARIWAEMNIPDRAMVAAEPGGPSPDASYVHFHQVLLPMHTTDPKQSTPVYSPLWYAPFDYFIVVEGVESRYRNRPDRFPQQVSFYDHLNEQWEEAARFGHNGQGIRIHRNVYPDRGRISAYPDTLYRRLNGMSRTLLGRYLERMGKAFIEKGRLALAGDIYNRLVTNFPDSQEFTMAYTDVLISMKQHDKAIRLLESRKHLGDEHLQATLRFLKGEFEHAVEAWTSYAHTHPASFRVRINLGRLLIAMNRKEEALSWYLDAAESKREVTEAFIEASRLQRELGDTAAAVRTARRGLARWPGNRALIEAADGNKRTAFP